jgi:ABC-type lipoprotein release transport system permease subunit
VAEGSAAGSAAAAASAAADLLTDLARGNENAMFITYLLRELRRRMRQAIFVAAGLALGIGLVITVIAASTGVSNSQGTVLHSLYGVGTDVTVTRAPAAGSGRPPSFAFGGGASGQAGSSFSRNVLRAPGLGTLKSSSVTTISGLKDVSAASGSLSLTDLSLSGTVPSGTVPSGSSQGGFGGGGGSGSISSSSFTVTGIDPAGDSLGPLSSATITSGHGITTAESNDNVAVVDSNYAAAQSLKTGSTVTVGGKTFTVVGIAQAAQSTSTSDVYIPLARAQSLAGMTNEVNTIYVAAASSADISTVSTEISSTLPKATVTTSADLASQVTGSLSSASSLANSLGKWLAVAVMAAAFFIASILTISAVSRRVREFGTLKAMGWRSRRIIRQIMGEALVIGVVGGIAGVALGYGGAALIQSLAPPLTASTGAAPTGAAGAAGAAGRFGPGGGGGGLGRAAAAASHTVSVHLTAPVTLDAVGLAVVLAILGGLIAGSFGGWRAVRLRPAAALARVE